MGRLLIPDVAFLTEPEDSSFGPTLTEKLRDAVAEAGYTLTGEDPTSIMIGSSYGTLGVSGG